MREASEKNRRVVIISHIPPGPEKGWLPEAEIALALVLQQHNNTLMALLVGDSNANEYRTIGNTVGMVVAGVSLRFPNNPVFRSLIVDPDANEIVGMKTYYNDVQQSNERHARVDFATGHGTKGFMGTEGVGTDSEACSKHWKLFNTDTDCCSQSQLQAKVQALAQGGEAMNRYKDALDGNYVELVDWVALACSSATSTSHESNKCVEDKTSYWSQFS